MGAIPGFGKLWSPQSPRTAPPVMADPTEPLTWSYAMRSANLSGMPLGGAWHLAFVAAFCRARDSHDEETMRQATEAFNARWETLQHEQIPNGSGMEAWDAVVAMGEEAARP